MTLSHDAGGRLAPSPDLVARLVAAQFPQWAALPIGAVEPGGRDNLTFRLGDALSVRLASAGRYVAQIDKERTWLPRLAPYLPVTVPEPVARGEPGEGFPFPFSVYRWIEGEPAAADRLADPVEFAGEIGGFLRGLRGIDATGGPAAGEHNFHRGGDLAVYDAQTRKALATLHGRIDTGQAVRVWDAALASSWQGTPVWVHGDIAPGNLLIGGGRLAAVIDFGSAGTGDPACDLVLAWTFFEGEARRAFLATLPDDPGLIDRARGWALWKALISLAPLADDDPAATAHRHTVDAVIGRA